MRSDEFRVNGLQRGAGDRSQKQKIGKGKWTKPRDILRFRRPDKGQPKAGVYLGKQKLCRADIENAPAIIRELGEDGSLLDDED